MEELQSFIGLPIFSFSDLRAKAILNGSGCNSCRVELRKQVLRRGARLLQYLDKLKLVELHFMLFRTSDKRSDRTSVSIWQEPKVPF